MDYKNSPCDFPSQSTSDLNLETVRALHQTVVALRAALEQSRSELFELRVKVNASSSNKVYSETIEKLALENHILRERVLTSRAGRIMEDSKEVSESNCLPSDPVSEPPVEHSSDSSEEKETQDIAPTNPKENVTDLAQAGILPEITTTEPIEDNRNVSLDEADEGHVLEINVDNTEGEEHGLEEKVPDLDQISDATENMKLENDEPSSQREERAEEEDEMKPKDQESDNESEELDDIELIFTTEETKELGVMQEDLVSIVDTENWSAVNGQPALPITVEKSTQFDEENTGLRMPWTVVVETDISKCGIIDENEAPPNNALRRNTLPSPMPYRPIIHKEVLSASKSPSHGVKFSSSRSPRTNGSSDSKRLPMRPILIESNSSLKRESEAQTDITALPSHWKSESYLAHKVRYILECCYELFFHFN